MDSFRIRWNFRTSMPYREAIFTTIGPAGRRILAIMRSELVGLILNALEMSYYYGSLVNSMKFGVLVAGQ